MTPPTVPVPTAPPRARVTVAAALTLLVLLTGCSLLPGGDGATTEGSDMVLLIGNRSGSFSPELVDETGEVTAPASLVDDVRATLSAGRTVHVPVSHEPWPLQPAQVVHLDDGLLAAAGFAGLADREPDSVLFASGVSTRFTLPRA